MFRRTIAASSSHRFDTLPRHLPRQRLPAANVPFTSQSSLRHNPNNGRPPGPSTPGDSTRYSSNLDSCFQQPRNRQMQDSIRRPQGVNINTASSTGSGARRMVGQRQGLADSTDRRTGNTSSHHRHFVPTTRPHPQRPSDPSRSRSSFPDMSGDSVTSGDRREWWKERARRKALTSSTRGIRPHTSDPSFRNTKRQTPTERKTTTQKTALSPEQHALYSQRLDEVESRVAFAASRYYGYQPSFVETQDLDFQAWRAKRATEYFGRILLLKETSGTRERTQQEEEWRPLAWLKGTEAAKGLFGSMLSTERKHLTDWRDNADLLPFNAKLDTIESNMRYATDRIQAITKKVESRDWSANRDKYFEEDMANVWTNAWERLGYRKSPVSASVATGNTNTTSTAKGSPLLAT